MKTYLVLSMLLVCGCVGVADDRAQRDTQVGHLQAGAMRVDVQDGLAAVRAIEPGRVSLWAQAPSLTITLTVPAGMAEASLRIENVLVDATLRAPGVTTTLVAAPVPTEKTWALRGLAPGANTLFLSAPDAASLAPWQFAVLADVQERLDDVQDIYDRINLEPGVRFVVFSGDLTRRGTDKQLQQFQAAMKNLRVPLYATLGNHELGTRDDIFHEYFGRGNFRFVHAGVQFTLLDSASATLAPVVYDWLDEWLAEGLDRLHFVFMHIPPLDPVGTRNGAFASRLEASKLLSRLALGKVDTTIYGHVHSFYAFNNAGIPAFITGGGGAIPERLDGIGRHFMVVDVDPARGLSRAGVVRVD